MRLRIISEIGLALTADADYVGQLYRSWGSCDWIFFVVRGVISDIQYWCVSGVVVWTVEGGGRSHCRSPNCGAICLDTILILQVKPLLEEIERNKLRWFGHVKRMNTEKKPRKFLEWRPPGKRPTGQPRRR